MRVPIAVAVIVFGIASAVMSVIGLELGAKLGKAAGEHGEVVAGMVLIFVAVAMAASWLLPRRWYPRPQPAQVQLRGLAA